MYLKQWLKTRWLEQIIAILNKDLVEKFAIEKPTNLRMWFEPNNAGEDGCLGVKKWKPSSYARKIRQKDGD